MNVLDFILSGLTGIGMMFLFLNAYVAYRSREMNYLGFVITGISAVIYIPCNILLYHVNTPAEYLQIVTVQMYGTAFYHCGLIILYSRYMKFPLRPVLTVYIVGFAFFLVNRQINPMFHYAQFSGMTDYVTIWGETLRLPVATVSLWGNFYLLLLFSVYITLLVLSLRQMRRGMGEHTALMFTSLAIFLFAYIHDTMVLVFNLRWLFLAEAGFTAVIVIMELALAEDAIRAYALARELNEVNAQLESRIHERTTELEMANKELESFTYSVSHDLRAPLRAMNGYATILKEDFARSIPPEALDYVEKVISSANHMSLLINGLLDFSRLGRNPLNRETIDLNALLARVIASFADEIAARQIEWRMEDLPAVHADPLLIEQVYINLIDNAVKYTGKCEKARIEVGCTRKDGEDVLFVRDNGAGFEMQYADKLFRVFQRLHNQKEFEGIGVGLAIVQRIIHRHGGRIWAESEKGKGAVFHFTLGKPAV